VGAGLGDAVTVGLAVAVGVAAGASVAVGGGSAGGGSAGAQAISPSSSRPASHAIRGRALGGKGIGNGFERNIVPKLGVAVAAVKLFVLVGEAQFNEALVQDARPQMKGVFVAVAAIYKQKFHLA
jgi:hypothetical protein